MGKYVPVFDDAGGPGVMFPIASVTSLAPVAATATLGYAAGAGAAVTQLTNRTTGVTLSKPTGQITTSNASLAALAAAVFTVTNTMVAATDMVLVCVKGGAVNAKTAVRVSAVVAGSFNITVHNMDAAAAETGAIIINFALLKAAAS